MEHEKSEHQQDKELRKIASSAKNRQDCDICRSFRKFCKIANSGSGRIVVLPLSVICEFLAELPLVLIL